METATRAERNIQQPQVHTCASLSTWMPVLVEQSLLDLRQWLRISFLPVASSLIPILWLWTRLYGISIPLSMASPATPSANRFVYRTISSLLHQQCPAHWLGLPYFSTLTTLKRTISVPQSLFKKVTENWICVRRAGTLFSNSNVSVFSKILNLFF